MRSQIIERFDANGDGELDASEREAAMKEMRERRGGTPRGAQRGAGGSNRQN